MTPENESKEQPPMIDFRDDTLATQVSKTIYNDSIYEGCISSCDLIIKTGEEKYEHYCHRIILASVSPFIWSVLETTQSGTTPVIILPDIKTSAIEYILSYVYNGEVYVPMGQYEEFKEACELLQIKGPVDNAVAVEVDAKMNEDDESDAEFDAGDRELHNIMYPGVDVNPELRLQIPELGFFATAVVNPAELNLQQIPEEQEEDSDSSDLVSNADDDIKSSLFSKLLVVYSQQNIKYTPTIKQHIKNTELVYHNNKLIKAMHSCGICGIKIGIACQLTGKSISWSNYNFKRHIIQACSKKMEQQKQPTKNDIKMEEAAESEDNDSSSSEQEDTQMYDINHYLPKRKSITNCPVLKDKDEIERYQKRLISTVKGVYERQKIEITPQIQEALEKSELVIEGNLLMKAYHVCALCNSQLSIGCQLKGTSFSWRSTNITRHLEIRCKKRKGDCIIVVKPNESD